MTEQERIQQSTEHLSPFTATHFTGRDTSLGFTSQAGVCIQAWVAQGRSPTTRTTGVNRSQYTWTHMSSPEAKGPHQDTAVVLVNDG